MHLLLLLFALCLSPLALSLTLDQADSYHAAADVTYIIDSHNFQITDIIQQDRQLPWQTHNQPQINFGFSQATYWLKLPVYNQNPEIHDWALEIAYPLLDYVDVYVVDDQQQIIDESHQGDAVNTQPSTVKHPHIVVPLLIKKNQAVTIYIRVQSDGSTQVPITIWQWSHFSNHTVIEYLLQGLFYGMVLIMGVYNFMVWLSEKQPIYLNYLAYIVFFSLFQISLNGIGFFLLWPQQAWLNNFLPSVLLCLLLSSICYFIYEFFELKTQYPRIGNISKTLTTLFLFMTLVCAILPYYISILLASTMAIVCIIYVLFISSIMLKEKHVNARYFALAWLVFLSGAVLLTANKFALIPITLVSEYSLQFGAALEIMFLSLALADRMTNAQKEQVVAQENSLALALQVNTQSEQLFLVERENLRLEKQHRQELENLVTERTEKLQSALCELEEANSKLHTLSTRDALTALYNRYYFNEHFNAEYKRAQRDETNISLIMIDIDHFKKINDTYGHPAGDQCLIEMARCLENSVGRDQDIVCRLGGEEFVVILPSTNEKGALQVAQSIRQNVESLNVQWQKFNIQFTASLGITSERPKIGDEKHQDFMINQADISLYRAKKLGRNRVCVFEHEVI